MPIPSLSVSAGQAAGQVVLTQQQQIEQQRQQLEQQQTQAQLLQRQLVPTQMQLRGGALAGIQALPARAEMHRQFGIVKSYGGEVAKVGKEFETQVAQVAPEYAKPELKVQALSQAQNTASSQVKNLQDQIEGINKSLEYYSGKSGHESTIDSLQNKREVVQARLEVYKGALEGDPNALIKQHFSGELASRASYVGERIEAQQERAEARAEARARAPAAPTTTQQVLELKAAYEKQYPSAPELKAGQLTDLARAAGIIAAPPGWKALPEGGIISIKTGEVLGTPQQEYISQLRIQFPELKAGEIQDIARAQGVMPTPVGAKPQLTITPLPSGGISFERIVQPTPKIDTSQLTAGLGQLGQFAAGVSQIPGAMRVGQALDMTAYQVKQAWRETVAPIVSTWEAAGKPFSWISKIPEKLITISEPQPPLTPLRITVSPTPTSKELKDIELKAKSIAGDIGGYYREVIGGPAEFVPVKTPPSYQVTAKGEILLPYERAIPRAMMPPPPTPTVTEYKPPVSWLMAPQRAQYEIERGIGRVTERYPEAGLLLGLPYVPVSFVLGKWGLLTEAGRRLAYEPSKLPSLPGEVVKGIIQYPASIAESAAVFGKPFAIGAVIGSVAMIGGGVYGRGMPPLEIPTKIPKVDFFGKTIIPEIKTGLEKPITFVPREEGLGILPERPLGRVFQMARATVLGALGKEKISTFEPSMELQKVVSESNRPRSTFILKDSRGNIIISDKGLSIGGDIKRDPKTGKFLETPEQSMIRELKEETGLSKKDIKSFKFVEKIVYPQETHYVFTGILKDMSKIIPSSDFSGVKLVSAQELRGITGPTALNPILNKGIRVYEAGIINYLETGQKPQWLVQDTAYGKYPYGETSVYDIPRQIQEAYHNIEITTPITGKNVVFDLDNTLIEKSGKLRPNVKDFLDKLKEDGNTLYLWTHSTKDRTNKILSDTGLKKYFDKVVTREDYALGDKIDLGGKITPEVRANFFKQEINKGLNPREYYESRMKDAGMNKNQIKSILDRTPTKDAVGIKQLNSEDVVYSFTEHNLALKEKQAGLGENTLKDIRKIGGDILIDNRDFNIKAAKDAGISAIKVTSYKKGESQAFIKDVYQKMYNELGEAQPLLFAHGTSQLGLVQGAIPLPKWQWLGQKLIVKPGARREAGAGLYLQLPAAIISKLIKKGIWKEVSPKTVENKFLGGYEDLPLSKRKIEELKIRQKVGEREYVSKSQYGYIGLSYLGFGKSEKVIGISLSPWKPGAILLKEPFKSPIELTKKALRGVEREAQAIIGTEIVTAGKKQVEWIAGKRITLQPAKIVMKDIAGKPIKDIRTFILEEGRYIYFSMPKIPPLTIKPTKEAIISEKTALMKVSKVKAPEYEKIKAEYPKIKEPYLPTKEYKAISYKAPTVPYIKATEYREPKITYAKVPEPTYPKPIEPYKPYPTLPEPKIPEPRRQEPTYPKPIEPYKPTPRYQKPKIPEPKKPIYEEKKKPYQEPYKVKRKAPAQGFTVQVRRRKKFGAPLPISVPKEEAFAIGARAVTRAAAATFKIVPSKLALRPIGIRLTMLERAVIRPGRKPMEFVQKERLRIVTPGEVKEISLVGAAARRAGAGRKSSRSKSKNMWGI